MVPDKIKEQIEEEELYRREVKIALEKSNKHQTKRHGLWSFLNSSFCLWFLSTVVLSSVTFFYSKHSEGIKIQSQNRVMIHKLDTEIKSRLFYIASKANPNNFDIDTFSIVLLAIEEPEREEYPINVFGEYKKRNMKSLLWELHTVLPDEAKPEIENALDAAFGLREFYEEYKNEIEKKHGFSVNIPNGSGDLSEDYRAELYAPVMGIINQKVGSFKVREQFAPFDLERWGKPFTNKWN